MANDLCCRYHIEYLGKNDAFSEDSMNSSISHWSNDIGTASGKNSFNYGEAGYYSMLSTGSDVSKNGAASAALCCCPLLLPSATAALCCCHLLLPSASLWRCHLLLLPFDGPCSDTHANGDYRAVVKAVDWMKNSPPEPFVLFLPGRGAHPPYGSPREFNDM